MLNRPYPYSIYDEAKYVIGVDVGFGSGSQMAIVMLQLWDRKVHVHTAIQSSRPNEDEVIERIISLYESTNRQANIFVDAGLLPIS